MAGLVVPYRGSNDKSRLAAVGREREPIALAMLADVLAACVAVGPTTVVTNGEEATAVAVREAIGDLPELTDHRVSISLGCG